MTPASKGSRTCPASRSECSRAARSTSDLPEVDALLQKTGGKLGKVSLYASYPEAYQDLANGRIDYVLNSVVAIADVLRKRPNEFELGQPSCRSAITPGR